MKQGEVIVSYPQEICDNTCGQSWPPSLLHHSNAWDHFLRLIKRQCDSNDNSLPVALSKLLRGIQTLLPLLPHPALVRHDLLSLNDDMTKASGCTVRYPLKCTLVPSRLPFSCQTCSITTCAPSQVWPLVLNKPLKKRQTESREQKEFCSMQSHQEEDQRSPLEPSFRS